MWYHVTVMKKIFTYFLMFLILMPGVACGPFMNAGKAHAAQPMQGMADCHGADKIKLPRTPDDGGHVFFKDCMKNDLSGVDHTILKAPDISGKTILAMTVPVITAFNCTPASTRTIRGPPPDWPVFSQTQPSLLLTTQRLRI